MSEPCALSSASDARLYRASAVAGGLAAVVLTVNVLRRAGAVPTNTLTHVISPLAAVLALFAVTGLYLWHRRSTGSLGLVGYVLLTAGFAGAVGTEVTVHAVFPHLPESTVDALVDGPVRAPFVAIGAVFSLGAVVLAVAMYRAARLDRVAVVGFGLGLGLFGWRGALPEIVVTIDGIASAVAITWLSWQLWSAQAPSGAGGPGQEATPWAPGARAPGAR